MCVFQIIKVPHFVKIQRLNLKTGLVILNMAAETNQQQQHLYREEIQVHC
jgi:hypothetical protein